MAISRASNKVKHDYAPLQAPPNPDADAARAALREYGAQLFKNARQTPSLDDMVALAAARAQWPAMRLLDSATVGAGMWWCPQCGISHERGGVVVVEVKGSES